MKSWLRQEALSATEPRPRLATTSFEQINKELYSKLVQAMLKGVKSFEVLASPRSIVCHCIQYPPQADCPKGKIGSSKNYVCKIDFSIATINY